MKSPRCQHENPPLAKFCLECGARGALTYPKCRSELPAGANSRRGAIRIAPGRGVTADYRIRSLS